MTRITFTDLSPNTDYAIQLRTVDGDRQSDWSRKFALHTITNNNQPAVPTNITWIVSGPSFLANWDTVTKDIQGKNTDVVSYVLELTAVDTGVVRHSIIPQTTEPRGAYDFSQSQNATFFNGIQKHIKLRIKSVNAAGLQSDYSAYYDAQVAAPTTPTNFVATGATDSIGLKWDADPTGPTFICYVGLTAGFTPSGANQIYSGRSNTFTYSTTTYQTQYFKLCAVNDYGQQSGYATASAAPVSPFLVDSTPPSVPTGLAVTSTVTGSTATAQLSWTFDATAAGNTDVQAFVIKWRKVGDANYSLQYTDKASRSLQIPLPQAYTDYEFSIASVDIVANYSAYSAIVTLSNSVPGPPPQVTGVTATSGLDGIQLNWTASTAGDVVNGGYYKVEIATNSGFTTGLLTYNTGNTSITVNGLAPTTTYYYRVTAVDSTALSGTASTTGNIATTAFPTPALSDTYPPASSPTPTITGGIGYLMGNWSAVTTNSNGGAQSDQVTYEVHIGTTSGFTAGPTTKVTETNSLFVTLEKDASGTALAYGTTYYMKLIAKDRDGSAAAGSAGSGSPVQAQSYDIASVSATNIQGGTIGAYTLILGTGGIFQSANYNPTTKHGFALTDSSLIMYDGSIDAKNLTTGTSITSDLSVTGNMTISSSGTFKSALYSSSGGTQGFSLSSAGLDIRTGTIAAGTLVAGTISSTGISIGAGGGLTVDSTGYIRSNTYSPGSTGWRITSTGIELNDTNSSVYATSIKGGTFTGGNFIVGSGGTIQSSDYNTSTKQGWGIGNGFMNLYNGLIYGSSIQTNALTSIQTDSTSGLPLFSINSGGYATLAGARIYGNTVLGNGTGSHTIASYNYSPGSAGWSIRDDGTATFNSTLTINNGAVYGSVFSTAPYTAGATSNKMVMKADASGGRIEGYTGNPLEGVAAVINPIVANSPTRGALVLQSPNFGNGVSVMSITSGGVGVGPFVYITGGFSTSGGIYTATGFLDNSGDGGISGTAVVFNTTTNRIYKQSSTRKLKDNIKTLSLDVAKKTLGLRSVTFNAKNDSSGVTYPGFIAEESHDAGANLWVVYDKNNEPEGFRYAELTSAHNVLIQDLYKEIEDLKKQVKALS